MPKPDKAFSKLYREVEQLCDSYCDDVLAVQVLSSCLAFYTRIHLKREAQKQSAEA